MDYVYRALDNGYIPDFLLRLAIRHLNAERLASLAAHAKTYTSEAAYKRAYISSLSTNFENGAIAIETEKANAQHYEINTDFMLSCLGQRAKYSCCLYETGKETLDEAEEAMLNLYCEKAQLRDGQDVLDLGCGWGSLCLYLAERYPNSRIRALSNSKTQKIHIDGVAKQKGFKNLTVFTGDVKEFEFGEDHRFDRVLSIEMFEHMKNYLELFEKVSRWLKSRSKSDDDSSKLFIHIFCHHNMPYHFEESDGWMAKNFFTGGTMPSHDLFLHFQQHVVLEDRWWLNGTHYARTCEHWLQRQDAAAARKGGSGGAIDFLRADAVAKGVPASEGAKTFWRFRVFYLACAEFFNTPNKHGVKGEEWGVGHYLFAKRD
ncbi:S-adenosyl-L-methionine-dependent methyltransferase [Tilletiaria anomala UBC 951]|uniref:S-adenosyl-L-methionine-dependent methyltransferase n=1 Tax=Tilletiaria anomala (strain ATCC 24038 / CBS 436.72 / UBC 951) TaxID=1037660 RepID=A0A066VIG3_TILAU|nr:S-adenosyl-L-methionine-dependent methyltransferase [Tilletiaria anomala UBC 951]KDN38519.1 S-adenosyl-L-methionine-dependent methyltransferase [Tilletiaria anomala UBC 951]